MTRYFTTEEREAKIPTLPHWAQEHIHGLQRQIKSQRDRIQELAGEDPEADTFADPYSSEDYAGSRPIGKGSLIRFGGTGYERTFDVRLEDGVLRVQGNSTFQTEMALLLSHSNVVNVAFVPRVR